MNRTDYILVFTSALFKIKGQNSKKGKGEAKPMFMKRPKKDAKFRHNVNCTFNVKRYSLAPERFHKYPDLILRCLPFWGPRVEVQN